MNKAALTLACVALVSSGCATGQRPERERHRRPGAAGSDGERRPRVQLFISPSGKPFRAQPGEPYPVVVWFAEADGNGDGRITRDEFRSDADAFFPTVDQDGDGKLSMAEASRYEREIAPEIMAVADPEGSRAQGGGQRSESGGRRGGGGGGGHGGGGHGGGGRRGGGGGGGGAASQSSGGHVSATGAPQGAAMFSLINEPHPIRGADADLSFTVTAQEWRLAADRRFHRLDQDSDGALTLAELPPTPAQRRQAGRAARP